LISQLIANPNPPPLSICPASLGLVSGRRIKAVAKIGEGLWNGTLFTTPNPDPFPFVRSDDTAIKAVAKVGEGLNTTIFQNPPPPVGPNDNSGASDEVNGKVIEDIHAVAKVGEGLNTGLFHLGMYVSGTDSNINGYAAGGLDVTRNTGYSLRDSNGAVAAGTFGGCFPSFGE
jgi:hypothetical protein